MRPSSEPFPGLAYRLCLEVKDFIRANIVAKKIQTKTFKERREETRRGEKRREELQRPCLFAPLCPRDAASPFGLVGLEGRRFLEAACLAAHS